MTYNCCEGYGTKREGGRGGTERREGGARWGGGQKERERAREREETKKKRPKEEKDNEGREGERGYP